MCIRDSLYAALGRALQQVHAANQRT
ncbi:hypothetical protein AZ022_004479, partial [Klebsiella pneumoniae]